MFGSLQFPCPLKSKDTNLYFDLNYFDNKEKDKPEWPAPCNQKKIAPLLPEI